MLSQEQKMSHSKSHLPLRKDSEGKNLFTWKQFSSPLNGISSSAMGRENKSHSSFEFIADETKPEQVRMVSEGALLKEANSNLMKKILQKDQECQDLQERLIQSTKYNNDLLIDLKEANMANQRLRLQSLALQEENDLLHTQLSAVRRKFTSHGPSSSGLSCFPLWSPSQAFCDSNDLRNSEQQRETWEDVSNQMLKQIQLEMKKLEEDTNCMPTQDDSHSAPLASPEDNLSIDVSSKVEQPPCKLDPVAQQCELEGAQSLIQLLKSQVEQLKTQLSTQGTVMRNTLGQIHKFFTSDPSLRVKARMFNQLSSQGNDSQVTGSKFNRPSDELFRAYFTQQLHSSASNAVIKTPESEARTVNTNSSEECAAKPSNSSALQEKTGAQDQICPICERIMPPGTSEGEFESHVFDCLDRETVGQFEII